MDLYYFVIIRYAYLYNFLTHNNITFFVYTLFCVYKINICIHQDHNGAELEYSGLGLSLSNKCLFFSST